MKSLHTFRVLKCAGPAAVTLCLALAGCANQIAAVDAASQVARQTGAEVADRHLEHAVWSLCNAQSIGAIRRRFGGDASSAAAYSRFCRVGQGLEPELIVTR